MPLNWNLINDEDSSVEGCDYSKQQSLQETNHSIKYNLLNLALDKTSQSLSQKHKQKLKINKLKSLKEIETADLSPKAGKRKIKYQQKPIHNNKFNQKQIKGHQNIQNQKEFIRLNKAKEGEINNSFNPAKQRQLTLLKQKQKQNKELSLLQNNDQLSLPQNKRLQVQKIQEQPCIQNQHQSQNLENTLFSNQQILLENQQELLEIQQRALSDSDFEQELEKMRKSLKNKNKKMKRKKQGKQIPKIDSNNPFSLLQKV